MDYKMTIKKKLREIRIDYFRDLKSGKFIKLSDLGSESEFYDLVMSTMMFYDSKIEIKHLKLIDLRSQINLLSEIISEWNKFGKCKLYPYLDIDSIISFNILKKVCINIYNIEKDRLNYDKIYFLEVLKRKKNGKKIKFILKKNK